MVVVATIHAHNLAPLCQPVIRMASRTVQLISFRVISTFINPFKNGWDYARFRSLLFSRRDAIFAGTLRQPFIGFTTRLSQTTPLLLSATRSPSYAAVCCLVDYIIKQLVYGHENFRRSHCKHSKICTLQFKLLTITAIAHKPLHPLLVMVWQQLYVPLHQNLHLSLSKFAAI